MVHPFGPILALQTPRPPHQQNVTTKVTQSLAEYPKMLAVCVKPMLDNNMMHK